MKRICAFLLCLCLLASFAVLPVSALDRVNLTETYPDFQERFSTDSFEESSGRLIPYNSESLLFSIRGSGASFSFTPMPITGKTSCNAYRFVLINNTVSNRMTVTYSYRESEEVYTSECELEQSQTKQTCLIYIPDAERVDRITVSFFGVRSGSVRLYSINPVSAYRPVSEEFGSITSCVANLSDATVTLGGRVLSGVTAKYTDAKLLLYRLPTGTDPDAYLADENRAALAETKILSKFSFTVPAENAGDRLSRYLVTIRISDGAEVPLTDPTYVTSLGGDAVPGTVPSDSAYKGIVGDATSTVISLGAGSTIVDVYLDRLLSDAKSPISYTSGGVTLQIDRSTITELDSRIRAYMASGCTVYLRYLISPDATDFRLSSGGGTDARYQGIFLSGNDSAAVLYSVTGYLADRYSGQAFGRLGGVILGTGVDRAAEYNDCGTLSLNDYVQNFARVALTVRLAFSKGGYDMQVVVPVTDNLSAELIGEEERDGFYDKYLFLSGLQKLFSESDFSGYTVLLESGHIPYPLQINESGDMVPGTATTGFYTAANAAKFEDLLSESGMGKQGYLVGWSPSEELSDTELIVSYLYSYHSFRRSGGPAVLFLCVDRTRLQRLSHVLSGIDTEEGSGQDAFVLGVFSATSWQELFHREKTGEVRQMFSLDAGIAAENAAGTYAIFDFTSALGTLNWNADPNVSGFGIGVSKTVGRALAATVNFSADSTGGIYYTFTYPENMSLYDSLAFCFAVEDLDDVRSVFELQVTLYGDGFAATGTALAGSGEETECSFDTSSLPGAVRSVRVTVRSVSGSDSSCRVYFRDITACSKDLDSAELQSLIENARAEARKDAERVSDTLGPVGVTVLIVLAVATVLLCLFLIRQSKHRRTS